MKSTNAITKFYIALFAICIAVISASSLHAKTSSAYSGNKNLDINERMINRRAIELIVWSQPLMNYKAMRDAFFANGARYNDVAYHSKVQNWKFQIATPNSTTPYIWTCWNLKDGPVVVEIPLLGRFPAGDPG